MATSDYLKYTHTIQKRQLCNVKAAQRLLEKTLMARFSLECKSAYTVIHYTVKFNLSNRMDKARNI